MSFSRPRFAPVSNFDGKDRQLKRKHSEIPPRVSGNSVANPSSVLSKPASNMDPSGKAPLSRSFKDSAGGSPSSNMYEVKTIFNRVDQVFKERKEETVRLVWEISDLENQLDYLRNTTQEHCDISASLAANMSMVRGASDKVQDGVEKLRSGQFMNLQDEVNMHKDQEKEVQDVINYAKMRSQDWLSRRVKLVDEYKPLQIREEQRRDELVSLVEYSLFAQEELRTLQLMNEELCQTVQEEQDVFNLLQEQTTSCKEALDMQREDYGSTNLALEQADIKKRLLISTLDHKQATAVALHETLRQRQLANMQDVQTIQLEIQHVMQHIEQLRLEGDYQRQRLDAHRRQRAYLEMKILESDKTLANLSNLSKDLQQEHCQLSSDIAQAVEEIRRGESEVEALSAIVDKSNRENEASYDLICERLRQIKEFQLQEPLLKHELLQNERKLVEAEASLDQLLDREQKKLAALLVDQRNMEAKVNEVRQASQTQLEEMSRMSLRKTDIATVNSNLADQLEKLKIEEETQGRLQQMIALQEARLAMMEEDSNAKSALSVHLAAETKVFLDDTSTTLLAISELEAKLAAPVEFSEDLKAKLELEVEREMDIFKEDWRRQHGKDTETLKDCIAKLNAGIPSNAHTHLLNEIADLEKQIRELEGGREKDKENQGNRIVHGSKVSDQQKKGASAEPQSTPSKLFGSTSKLARKFSSGGSQLSQTLPASRQGGNAMTLQRPRSNSDGFNSLSKASLEDLFLDDNSTF